MLTASDPTSPAQTAPQTGSEPTSALNLAGFYPPPLILQRLSAAPERQPVAALAAANQHQAELTEPFLQAIERGLANPLENFSSEGMLFNYGAYFLAKWREPRAYPLFLRWLSLPGEEALELGGDTVTHDGARFLASVCRGDRAGLKELAVNRNANPHCRGQAILALGVLMTWGELPREEFESDLLWLAREGLERQAGLVWHHLAAVSLHSEALPVFPELRRAHAEGLIDPKFIPLEEIDQVEREGRGTLAANFAQRYRPVEDVVQETRWWAGFQRAPTGATSTAPGEISSETPYLAPEKVGRNDACPCGSGKKYKKCCGARA
jgi:hypothetical protein